jgi:hypothetical protein
LFDTVSPRLGYISVVIEFLSSIHEALTLIPSTTKKNVQLSAHHFPKDIL